MGRGVGQLSEREKAEAQRGRQAWWGIIGLVLVVCFGAMSFVLSKPVADSTIRLVPGIAPETWQLFCGIAVFVAALAISGIIFSIFAPRKKDMFSERELNRERKELQAEYAAKKNRQKAMRKQIAKARREGK